MQTNRVFNQLIAQLLKLYSSDIPTKVDENERHIYTFTLKDDIKVNVLSDEQGYLHMVGFIPMQTQAMNADHLSELLRFNHFNLHHPFYVIGVDSEHQETSLHVRQPMSELDSSAAFNLFENMIDKVVSLQIWLEKNRI